MSTLAQSIYNTIAFFDAQNFSLTLIELRNYLVAKKDLPADLSLGQIEKCTGSELHHLIVHKSGLFFLKGREELIEKRKQRYTVSLVRMRETKKYLRPLRHFPYLRAAALSGSAAIMNSGEDSDIDLFIIIRRNRIWIARFIVSVYFHFLGRRRHGEKIAGRFCLNHYLSEDYQIQQDRNLYTAVIYASLVPMLGEKALEKFRQDNKWMESYFCGISFPSPSEYLKVKFSIFSKIFENILEYSGLGPALNSLLGKYQRNRIRQQEHILVSDDELSLHPGSRGQQVLARYEETLKS